MRARALKLWMIVAVLAFASTTTSAQNTALNRTTAALLTNKSGGALTYGAVVVIDSGNASSFTTTTTAGISTAQVGVILEPNGIANNASGMVAFGGWAPRVNLNTSASIGQFIKTHTVAGQGTPHASPQAEGDFAVALEASANPKVLLFSSPNGPLSGGAGTVTNTGTLTSGALVIGNGGVDVSTTTTGTGVVTFLGTPSSANLATAVTGETGSGALVFATSPALTTPDLGTPSAATLTNATGLVCPSGITTALGCWIADATPSATGTFTFSSLGSFRHLIIDWQARGTQSATSVDMSIQFNADTGAHYDWQLIYAAGTGTPSMVGTMGATSGIIGSLSAGTATATFAGSGRILIKNYRGTTFSKQATADNYFCFDTTGGSCYVRTWGVNWRDASAITSITLLLSAGNYVANSVFSLYGTN